MHLRTRPMLSYAVALAVLLAVFMLYTRADIMVSLAEQLWACF